jgi:hypothetical protein
VGGWTVYSSSSLAGPYAHHQLRPSSQPPQPAPPLPPQLVDFGRLQKGPVYEFQFPNLPERNKVTVNLPKVNMSTIVLPGESSDNICCGGRAPGCVEGSNCS